MEQLPYSALVPGAVALSQVPFPSMSTLVSEEHV